VTDNTETTELEEVEVESWEDAPDDLKEHYRAGDIDPETLAPWDVSRAWKTLVLMRDLYLDRQDMGRAMGYSQVAADLAEHLIAQGWPVPLPDGSDVIMPDDGVS
jgi:hypothetical protein